MVSKQEFNSELWSFFEYFLALVSEGIHLKCFSLIDKGTGIPGKGEAYLHEKITRKIVNESAREIKTLAKEYVETDKQDQLQGISKTFQESIKEILLVEIKKTLNTKLIDHMIDQLKQDQDGDSMFIMASLYYCFYKNNHIPEYVLHPFYFNVFTPFLTISQVKLPENIAVWQKMLNTKILTFLENNTDGTCNLIDFFEDESVKKIISISFAGILAVMNEKKDLTHNFFIHTHHLNEFHLKTFKMYIANGFYTSKNKKKRFTPKSNAMETPDQFRRLKAIPLTYVSGIINRLVDRNFNKSLEMIVQYYQSGKTGKYKKYLLRNYERAFPETNKKIWKEIKTIVKTQMQVCYRSKYLLRLVLYYVFDKSDADREFWVKYIPVVEQIIHYIYNDENEDLININKNLNHIIGQYKDAKLFHGTDWEGFYSDPGSKKIAGHMIHTIVDKGASRHDINTPATWFTNLMIKGIDEIALLRFFRRALKHV